MYMAHNTDEIKHFINLKHTHTKKKLIVETFRSSMSQYPIRVCIMFTTNVKGIVKHRFDYIILCLKLFSFQLNHEQFLKCYN